MGRRAVQSERRSHPARHTPALLPRGLLESCDDAQREWKHVHCTIVRWLAGLCVLRLKCPLLWGWLGHHGVCVKRLPTVLCKISGSARHPCLAVCPLLTLCRACALHGRPPPAGVSGSLQQPCLQLWRPCRCRRLEDPLQPRSSSHRLARSSSSNSSNPQQPPSCWTQRRTPRQPSRPRPPRWRARRTSSSPATFATSERAAGRPGWPRGSPAARPAVTLTLTPALEQPLLPLLSFSHSLRHDPLLLRPRSLASEPVVTLCGHLYCWPCLYRWLQVQSHCRTCPVCKAGVEKDKVGAAGLRGSRREHRRAAWPPQPAPTAVHSS